jgi:hypothetical protein
MDSPLQDLINKMEEAAVAKANDQLDQLIDAIAEDLTNPEAPVSRATAIMDIGARSEVVAK